MYIRQDVTVSCFARDGEEQILILLKGAYYKGDGNAECVAFL